MLTQQTMSLTLQYRNLGVHCILPYSMRVTGITLLSFTTRNKGDAVRREVIGKSIDTRTEVQTD